MKDPQEVLAELYPEASWGEKQTVTSLEGIELPYWELEQDGELLAYAFETNDIHKVPAYSGEPVNMLVVISPSGQYMAVKVLEHHEPILLVGIPEEKLYQFADQYNDLSITDRIRVGGSQSEDQTHIDGLSGATVTVMVMNVGVTRSATELARALKIIEGGSAAVEAATVNQDYFEVRSWQQLSADQSIRRLALTKQDVDEAFKGTAAADVEQTTGPEGAEAFTEIYYTLLNIPTIGRNILDDTGYQSMMENLEPGEHVLGLFGNGYSFKGSGYVRGGIFDRIQLLQDELAISFRDLDQSRLSDIYSDGAPEFKEMSMFIIRPHHRFDPGKAWQFELLVRRQLGAIDSVFTSFKGDYAAPEQYLIRPEVKPELELWQQVWQDKTTEVVLLLIALLVLLLILFFQDWLVRYPRLVHNVRNGYLFFTVVFIGWYCAGQISIVNVFTFLQALMSDFNWQIFLLDPVIFIIWVSVAVTGLLWGRGVFCGWLCPFGALQELLNHFARWLKVPQFEPPFAVHERLWALKYLILLGLFGVSLQSLAAAERFAEIEPFKTTFLLKFAREWGYVAWAIFLLVINLFTRKLFCRYLCPLGAALSVPTNLKLFDWLKRRPECGQPCKICANECEIQAIQPDGIINQRECHYCMDCQMSYFNDHKCPPLVKQRKKQQRQNKLSPEKTPSFELVYHQQQE